MLPTTNTVKTIIKEELQSNNIKIFAIFNDKRKLYRRIKVVLVGTPNLIDITQSIFDINSKLIENGFDATAICQFDGRIPYIAVRAQL